MPLAAFPKCYLDALTLHRTMTVEQWIDLAADRLDVDGLEFYWGFTPFEDANAVRALRKRMESRGLQMPMMCCSPDFTQLDEEGRTLQIEGMRRAIETTAHLGGGFCRVLSGQKRPEITQKEGVRMASEAIQTLLPDAESCGVVLILENHYKDGYWDFPEFAQRADVFLELLDSIPISPWFGVNFDPSNAIIAGDDPIELLEAVKSRVVTMHASDRFFENGTLAELRQNDLHPTKGYASYLKHGVIGRGLNDYDRIFGILKNVGFQGWISIEDGDDPSFGMEHLQQSATFLRAKMKEYGLP